MKKKILKIVLAVCLLAALCVAVYYVVRKVKEEEAKPLNELAAFFRSIFDKVTALKKAELDLAADLVKEITA